MRRLFRVLMANRAAESGTAGDNFVSTDGQSSVMDHVNDVASGWHCG